VPVILSRYGDSLGKTLRFRELGSLNSFGSQALNGKCHSQARLMRSWIRTAASILKSSRYSGKHGLNRSINSSGVILINHWIRPHITTPMAIITGEFVSRDSTPPFPIPGKEQQNLQGHSSGHQKRCRLLACECRLATSLRALSTLRNR
jgi:hypothetical protein